MWHGAVTALHIDNINCDLKISDTIHLFSINIYYGNKLLARIIYAYKYFEWSKDYYREYTHELYRLLHP